MPGLPWTGHSPWVWTSTGGATLEAEAQMPGQHATPQACVSVAGLLLVLLVLGLPGHVSSRTKQKSWEQVHPSEKIIKSILQSVAKESLPALGSCSFNVTLQPNVKTVNARTSSAPNVKAPGNLYISGGSSEGFTIYQLVLCCRVVRHTQ